MLSSLQTSISVMLPPLILSFFIIAIFGAFWLVIRFFRLYRSEDSKTLFFEKYAKELVGWQLVVALFIPPTFYYSEQRSQTLNRCFDSLFQLRKDISLYLTLPVEYGVIKEDSSDDPSANKYDMKAYRAAVQNSRDNVLVMCSKLSEQVDPDLRVWNTPQSMRHDWREVDIIDLYDVTTLVIQELSESNT